MLLHITLKLCKYLNKPVRISIHIFKVTRQNGAIIVLKPRENALYLNETLFCLAATGFLGNGMYLDGSVKLVLVDKCSKFIGHVFSYLFS